MGHDRRFRSNTRCGGASPSTRDYLRDCAECGGDFRFADDEAQRVVVDCHAADRDRELKTCWAKPPARDAPVAALIACLDVPAELGGAASFDRPMTRRWAVDSASC